MKFILGTKAKMVTVFTDEGRAFAATIVKAAPVVVTQLKTKEKEGYNAVQVGAFETKHTRVNKAQLGHAKAAQSGVDESQRKALKVFRELRPRAATGGAGSGELPAVEMGATVDVSAFAVGDKVTVVATSKSKGFQGVIKRHGFHGGPRTHGQKHSERSPGSIGGGGGRAGGRVAKGMRMAGRMGGDRVSVRNLKVLQVLPETNELVISGAIPGRAGTVVEVRG
jgi:large subunit ribosomal protein L3